VPYLSALEVCSRRGAIQIHVYLTLPYLTYNNVDFSTFELIKQVTALRTRRQNHFCQKLSSTSFIRRDSDGRITCEVDDIISGGSRICKRGAKVKRRKREDRGAKGMSRGDEGIWGNASSPDIFLT